MSFFHIVYFFIQAFQIAGFRIICLQILQTFNALLYAVLQRYICRRSFAVKILLDPRGKQCDHKCHRQNPHRRQSHAPVIGKQAHRNQRGGNDGTGQSGHIMGKCRFKGSTVAHNRTGQIRQIFFPEKGQGYFPQLLGKRDPSDSAFHISGQIRGVILKPGYNKYKDKAAGCACAIQYNPFPVHCPVHHVNNKEIQKPYGNHKGDILRDTCNASLNQIDGSLP